MNQHDVGILIEKYRPAAVLTANRFCRREDADDAIQSASIAAYQKWYQFDPSRNFGNWYLQIVKNACLQLIRYNNRRASASLESAEGIEAPDVLIDVLDRIEIEQYRVRLGEVIDTTPLTPLSRQAMRMVIIYRIPMDTSAALCRASRHTFNERIRRAVPCVRSAIGIDRVGE